MDSRSRQLRHLMIDALEGGGRGHVGSTFSLVEILTALFDGYLRFKSEDPYWPERDRLILSKGHGCIALYALLADKGFFPPEELRTFCRFGSRLGGHPERGKLPGIEASTGALGHGPSLGVGMALSAKLAGRSNRVVVICGDGEINEGSVWEAALSAAKHRLSNLTLMIDYNKMQSYGPTSEVLELEPLIDKWKAFGFSAREADGHDVGGLKRILNDNDWAPAKPRVVVCHTVKGKGFPIAEGKATWHHKAKMSSEDILKLRTALDKSP